MRGLYRPPGLISGRLAVPAILEYHFLVEGKLLGRGVFLDADDSVELVPRILVRPIQRIVADRTLPFENNLLAFYSIGELEVFSPDLFVLLLLLVVFAYQTELLVTCIESQ